MDTQTPAVEVRGVSKRFPGVVANDGVNLAVAAGEVHALLGENGAGKSTLSNVLSGLYQPDEGEVRLNGEPVVLGSPRDAIAAGIGMVHQHFMLDSARTVAENIILGDKTGPGKKFFLPRREIAQRIRELSELYGLLVDPADLVVNLAVGQQQRVEILKVLYRGAKVLVLDEPTANLTPMEVEALFDTIRRLTAEGRSVIFISHKLPEVRAIADRVTVLRAGKVVGTVERAEATPERLASMMVGRQVAVAQTRQGRLVPFGEVILAIENLTVIGDRGNKAVDAVSLQARAGEIVGIAGVTGNGQRELAEAIAGVRMPAAGAIRVNGTQLKLGRPREAIHSGVSYVPEDRLGMGVAPNLSVSANFAVKSYRGLSSGPLLRWRRIAELARYLIDRYAVQVSSPAVPARQLSGGNLQKVLLGREMHGEPKVMVLASPTRGLDIGAIETVHAYLREAAAGGVAVLLISEDLDEIFALSDQILVMYGGQVVGRLAGDGADREEIGLLMAGGRPEGIETPRVGA